MEQSVTEWQDACYNYFDEHEIKNREHLREKLKSIPLKVEGLTNQIIEGIFSLYNKSRRNIKKEQKRILGSQYKVICISDVHIPNHDPKALDLVFKFIKDQQPDELILLGDIIDCYWLSKFDHNPSKTEFIQEEADLFYRLFRPLVKAIPNTKITYVKGNHENRIKKEQMRNPALFGLRGLQLTSLLKLDKLNINYCDYCYSINGMKFLHGVKCSSYCGYTAKAEMDMHLCSGITGHTHRLGFINKTTDHVDCKGWVENGCLCDLYPEYEDNPNWQQGFSVINFNNGKPHINPIRIEDYSFYYGDKLYD